MSLGVAVLGMGRWGTIWSQVLERTSDVTLVPTTVDGMRRDFRDSMADPLTEAVVVTLPVALHLPAIEFALASGKHVLCEKPAVPQPADLATLMTLDTTSCVRRICQNYRARQWAIRARKAIEQIGPLSSVSIEFAQAEFMEGGRESLRHPLLADVSIHHVDLLRWLTGQEAHVKAAMTYRTPHSDYRGDTDISGLLELNEGAPATYTASWAAHHSTTPWDGNWRFRGADGVVVVSDCLVTIDRGLGPQLLWNGLEAEHEDLRRVWSDFEAALEGRAPTFDSAVTVDDHAQSLDIVFDMGVLAGVQAPYRAVQEK